MSKHVPTYYFVLHEGMSHSKYSWRREYLKLTLGKVDRLESVVEYEDKTIYRPRDLAFGLPTGTKRSTKLEYTQALLRYRQDAEKRKAAAALERELRKQTEQKLAGIRGLGPRPVPVLAAPAPPVAQADPFDDFTIIDTEYQGEHLLEVAAIRYQNWQPVAQPFASFVRFTGWIGPRVKELTGITETQVYRAPTEKTVLERLYTYAGDSLLIAHNIGADRSRLEAAHKRSGLPGVLPNKWFCTLQLARARLPKGAECGLEKLCERFRFPNTNAHRALSDVGRTFLVLRHFHHEEPLRSLNPKARQAAPLLFA